MKKTITKSDERLIIKCDECGFTLEEIADIIKTDTTTVGKVLFGEDYVDEPGYSFEHQYSDLPPFEF